MSKHNPGSGITPEQAFEAIMAEAMTTVSAHGGKHGVYLNNLAAIVRPACAQAPRLLEALERITEQYSALMKDCGLSSADTINEARAAIEATKGNDNG